MNTAELKRINLLKASLVAAVVLAACLLALVGSARPAGATFPGENGKIAWVKSTLTSRNEIYVMNPDGSDPTNLTNTATFDESWPAWSPDGTKIAFASTRDTDATGPTNYEIYVMNADGSNPTRLTNNAGNNAGSTIAGTDSSPAWSPDGTKIAFNTARDADATDPNNYEIYVMNADGSNPTRLTTSPGFDADPSWSPDGTKITFSSVRDDPNPNNPFNNEIYVMNADGSNPTRLTNDPRGDLLPRWSPDGTKISFCTNRDGAIDGNVEVYVMNADGSNPTNLTNDPGYDCYPTWSPDSTKIAFTSGRDVVRGGHTEIYAMNADGSNQTRLTTSPDTFARSSAWQPIPLVYNFSGFYQPVDNLPTLNKTKPGKTIPIRFGLGGDKGLEIFANGYPRSEAINCQTSAQIDDIEQTELGKSGLTYDAVSNRYTYHWATSSSWSGCRQFAMKLKDGSVQRANFIFR